MAYKDPAERRRYLIEWRAGLRRPRKPLSLAERLLRRTDREGGRDNPPPLGRCWEWTGATIANASGMRYGVIKEGCRVELVHRMALQVALGRPIREGFFACHKCDNPICLRPRHLYEGTVSENNQDIWDRGRRQSPERPERTRAEAAAALYAALEAEIEGV